MIAYLKGRVLALGDNFFVLDVNDIGYRIYFGKKFISSLRVGEERCFFIYHHIRENISELYGMNDFYSLKIFETLLSVNGVGPKLAVAILDFSDPKNLIRALAIGDEKMLLEIDGVGPKMAKRLVLELKEKLSKFSQEALTSGGINEDDNIDLGDGVEALASLGYSREESIRALMEVDKDLSLNDKIKKALNFLNKKSKK